MEKVRSRVMNCIWNIPICGGFCAPTKNPDPTVLKHFSNEWTVPASRVFMKVAPVVEWSPCCRFLASLGLPCASRRRKQVMLSAFVMSLIGWFLTLYPLFGLSQSSGLIRFAPWAKGNTKDSNGESGPLRVFMGLNARVDEVDCKLAPNSTLCEAGFTSRSELADFVNEGDGIHTRTVSWSDGASCSSIAGPLSPLESAVYSNHCTDCGNSATGTVSTAALGLLSQTVQMATNLQRSTLFGDVNCQASMGFATSVFGFLTTIMALRTFSQDCWQSLPTAIEGSDFSVQWTGGPAFFCLVAATVLKIWDAAAHFVLPAPPERRKPDTKITDVADYMMLAVKTQPATAPEGEPA